MSSSKNTSTPSPMSGNHQRVPFGMPPPSPSTAVTGTASGSAGKAAVQKAAAAGSPSITFHAPSPPRTNQASNFISHQTAGPSSVSSTAAAAAAASTYGAAGTAAASAVTAATANNSSYSLRQLLQSLALNPPPPEHPTMQTLLEPVQLQLLPPDRVPPTRRMAVLEVEVGVLVQHSARLRLPPLPQLLQELQEVQRPPPPPPVPPRPPFPIRTRYPTTAPPKRLSNG